MTDPVREAATALLDALKALDERGWTQATWELAKRAMRKAEEALNATPVVYEPHVIAAPFADAVVGPFPSYDAAKKHAVEYGYDMAEVGQIVSLIKPEDDTKEGNDDSLSF